jgi:hypothetical protein
MQTLVFWFTLIKEVEELLNVKHYFYKQTVNLNCAFSIQLETVKLHDLKRFQTSLVQFQIKIFKIILSCFKVVEIENVIY